jgi:anti-sigma regulatory factor (Ser/Thr protein kinase)
LGVNESVQSVREVSKYLTESSVTLCLDNEETLVPSVIARMEFPLIEMELFDEGERMQIAMALDEALLNGIIHGNLEVSSDLRQIEDGEPYMQMIKERKTELPYKDRRVRVSVVATREMVTFRISDDGPGFDASTLLDPTDPENLEKAGGRGLLLINAFMDEVSHNEKGNEITLMKRKVVSE